MDDASEHQALGRHGSYWRALDLLDRNIWLTRTQLATCLEMSATTVSGIVKHLSAQGLIAEDEPVASRHVRGRPAKTLRLVGPKGPIGIVAQSHSSFAVALAGFEGQLHNVVRVPVSRPPEPAELAREWLAVLDALLAGTNAKRSSLSRVVLGLPFPYYSPPSGAGLAPPSADALPAPPRGELGQPEADVHHYAKAVLGAAAELGRTLRCAVSYENDANLGALGEAVFGAAREAQSAVYVKLARDIGAGIVIGRRLFRGASGVAGELVHVPVDPRGTACACGGRGHLAKVAGLALRRLLGVPERAWLPGPAAVEGHETEPASLHDVGRSIGWALAGFYTMFNPGAVVIDGTLGDELEALVAGVSEILGEYCPMALANTLGVVRGLLGADAELYGGVVLARSTYLEELTTL